MKTILSALGVLCALSLPGVLAAAGSGESFEHSDGGWKAEAPATCASISIADGAPAEAVTEGECCLKITSEDGGKWSQLAVQQGLTKEITAADTLSFDVYVPAGVLPPDGWAKLQVRLFGGSGATASFDIHEDLALDINATKGKLYHFEWNYGAAPGFDPGVGWAQIALVKVASGGAMSPLYIDNLKFSRASADPAATSTNNFQLDDNWKLVWQDEFEGAKGAPPAPHWKPGAKWKPDGTWRDATLAPQEAYLDGKGNLVMRTEYKDGKRLAPYLVTSEKGAYSKAESVMFGPGENGIYIEWRANVSRFKARAAWFALWLFSDTPYTGDPAKGSEIDLMEYVPFKNETYSLMGKFNTALHLKDDGSASISPPKPYGHTDFDPEQWHTWGLLWTKEKQVFFLDGKPYWVNQKFVSSDDTHGLRMTIEIANGDPKNGNKNSWGHAVGKFEDNLADALPSYAYVDYVRVYRNEPGADKKN